MFHWIETLLTLDRVWEKEEWELCSKFMLPENLPKKKQPPEKESSWILELLSLKPAWSQLQIENLSENFWEIIDSLAMRTWNRWWENKNHSPDLMIRAWRRILHLRGEEEEEVGSIGRVVIASPPPPAMDRRAAVTKHSSILRFDMLRIDMMHHANQPVWHGVVWFSTYHKAE